MIPDTVTIKSIRQGKELYLDGLEWYFNYEGNVSIKTPSSTHVVYNKEAKSHRPFSTDFLQKHYLNPTVKYDPSNLESNQLGVKPFGDSQVLFEVLVTQSVVDDFCDTYPPITIV